MQEAQVSLKTIFLAKAKENVEEELQEFVLWFIENLSLFRELYGDSKEGINPTNFSIKLEE